MDPLLASVSQELRLTLAKSAAAGDLGRAAADAFGFLSLPESLWQLQEEWASSQFGDLPEIVVAPAASIASARGAYVSTAKSIVLNGDWLSGAEPAEVLSVLVEEVGHYLDARFNAVDTPGDEGELFSRVLLGQLPSAEERSRMISENDAIVVSLANGQLAAAEAAETLDPVVRVTGTAQADQLVGGSNADTLFGMGGNDNLSGGAGNDYLDGGAGNDAMLGGSGDDIYVVDSSQDLISEGSDGGKDSILSAISFALPDNVENLDLRTNGEAYAIGNDLDNVIYGGFAATRLEGGAGNDSLYGRGTNDDRLEGGEGDDYMDGGQGLDVMVGGIGNDTYVVRDSMDLVVEDSQAGSDWVYATTSFALSENVENIQLFSTEDGARATGNSSNNTLLGDAWSNILAGGEGDDYISGGVGADQMLGGAGSDTFVVDNEADVVIEQSGEGEDWVVSTVGHALADNVENLDLRGYSNLLGEGNAADNIIKGNLGNSTLRGGSGNDSLYGRGSGTDTLFGDDGNDYLDGGAGADVMDGGTGNDTFVVNDAGDIVVESANGGSDWIISDISTTLGDHLEGLLVRGRTGSEDLDGNGNDLNNTIIGNSGRNSLSGMDGNDILNGGLGSDVLAGGGGRDVFLIASKERDGSIAMDQISDFQTGQDILYVSRAVLNMDTTKIPSGTLSASDLAIVTSATEGGLEGDNGLRSTAKFVLDQSMGILYYNSNGAEEGPGQFATGVVQILNAEISASDIQLS
jgi:Ca2+-binding RTX toxin-like protein